MQTYQGEGKTVKCFYRFHKGTLIVFCVLLTSTQHSKELGWLTLLINVTRLIFPASARPAPFLISQLENRRMAFSSCRRKGTKISFIIMFHSFVRCPIASLKQEALRCDRDSSFRNEAIVIERGYMFLPRQNYYSSEAFHVWFAFLPFL